MSIGTSCISHLIRCLHSSPKYNYILPMIKAIILDSGLVVDANDAMKGFKNTLISQGGLKNKAIAKLILPLFKPFWIDHCTKDYPLLHSNRYNWGYLLLYNDNDSYFPGTTKSFINKLNQVTTSADTCIANNNCGRPIIETIFDSDHIQHFKNYPDQYNQSINNIIKISK